MSSGGSEAQSRNILQLEEWTDPFWAVVFMAYVNPGGAEGGEMLKGTISS